MSEAPLVVITAARNEADFLPKTIESVVSQTVWPREWVIVDDGSNDGTAGIAEAAARVYEWIRVVRLADRGFRDTGAGQRDAIHHGLAQLHTEDYEFLFNLDADIVLGPGYFKGILAKFAENPRLGIATGVICEIHNGRWEKLRRLPEMTFGAIKGWRRQCFQDIDGLVRGLGWEGVDNFRAMMLGWETKSFEDEALAVKHLRPMRSSIKNIYHGWARHGTGSYLMGSHPLWVLGSALYHMPDRPLVLGGVAMLIGYWREFYRGSPQYYDEVFRRFLRQWQLRRLAILLKMP